MTLQERLRALRGALWGDDGKTLDEAMALVDALDDKLTTTHTGTIDTWPTPKLALEALIEWEIAIALDPRVSSDARALVEQGEKQAADRIAALEAARDQWHGYCNDALKSCKRLEAALEQARVALEQARVALRGARASLHGHGYNAGIIAEVNVAMRSIEEVRR